MKYPLILRRRLARVFLRSVTPCCNEPVRFMALVDIPRECYERKCKLCGVRWKVTRDFMRDQGGVRMDSLTWESSSSIRGPRRLYMTAENPKGRSTC